MCRYDANLKYIQPGEASQLQCGLVNRGTVNADAVVSSSKLMYLDFSERTNAFLLLFCLEFVTYTGW